MRQWMEAAVSTGAVSVRWCSYSESVGKKKMQSRLIICFLVTL